MASLFATDVSIAWMVTGGTGTGRIAVKFDSVAAYFDALAESRTPPTGDTVRFCFEGITVGETEGPGRWVGWG